MSVFIFIAIEFGTMSSTRARSWSYASALRSVLGPSACIFMSDTHPQPARISRRHVLEGAVGAAVVSALGGCEAGSRAEQDPTMTPHREPSSPAAPVVHEVMPLDFVWTAADPFLFCVHHDDAYPAGNDAMGIDRAALRGRQLGSDFSRREGWSMYHGAEVPGFPSHPHRGFETVTIARRGYIDHSDSLGARARFGMGDAQWMTAGRGVVHSEMFPLVHRDRDNPVELFQIWLNLPRASKFVEPYFTMLWSEQIPERSFADAAGKRTEVTMVAGAIGDESSPAPPPDSWAARAEAAVAIWSVRMEPGATWTLPAFAGDDPAGVNRTLYFFAGSEMQIGERSVAPRHGARVEASADVVLHNGEGVGELLMLQGRPIGEPVVQHGPFVMNSRAEIMQAYRDYQRTQFGGWPWETSDPVHQRESGRFAVHADGREERVG